jgi:Na+-translocating ferredoxin:NAD+ oxidoreductase subunit D
MKFNFRVSPNYRTPLTTQRVMWEVTGAISLVLAFALYYYFTELGVDYGVHALLMILTSLAVAIGTEVLWALFYKKNIIKHLNTSFPWVIALIFVGTMSINRPLYVSAVSVFAGVFFGKLLFGGFGYNIFNPAGVGRAVAALSFSGFVTNKFADVVTGATANQVMQNLGWVITKPEAVDAFLNQFGGLSNLTLGFYPSSLGETSAVLLLVIGIYFSVRKIIDWKVPVVFIGSIFIFTYAIALFKGMGVWYPIFHVVSGGAMYAAVFMITDPVTTPTSSVGRILFAIGVAIFVVIIRIKANLPEGVVYGILFMNMLTPLLDQITDGWVYKEMKKYMIQIGSLFAVGLAVILLIASQISYNEPVVETVPEVVINLKGEPIVVLAELVSPSAFIVSKTADGDITTVVVNINGYAFGGEADDPQPNTLEVKINTTTQLVESVSYITFSDSPKIGDKTDSEVFLSQFVGLSIVDETASVDVVTGATITSQSVVRAVRAAIAAVLE